jgi:hypothetical protein
MANFDGGRSPFTTLAPYLAFSTDVSKQLFISQHSSVTSQVMLIFLIPKSNPTPVELQFLQAWSTACRPKPNSWLISDMMLLSKAHDLTVLYYSVGRLSD